MSVRLVQYEMTYALQCAPVACGRFRKTKNTILYNQARVQILWPKFYILVHVSTVPEHFFSPPPLNTTCGTLKYRILSFFCNFGKMMILDFRIGCFIMGVKWGCQLFNSDPHFENKNVPFSLGCLHDLFGLSSCHFPFAQVFKPSARSARFFEICAFS